MMMMTIICRTELVELYRNEDGMDKATLATRILKSRLSTYNVHKLTIWAASNVEHLEKKYRKACAEKYQENLLEYGLKSFVDYGETGDFNHMIRFYTAETPFFTMIHGDEIFTQVRRADFSRTRISWWKNTSQRL